MRPLHSHPSVAEPRGFKPFFALLGSDIRKRTFVYRSLYIGDKKTPPGGGVFKERQLLRLLLLCKNERRKATYARRFAFFALRFGAFFPFFFVVFFAFRFFICESLE